MNDPDAPARRRPTVSLGRLMVAIAIPALVTAAVVQSIRLAEAATREQRLRSHWENERARLEAAILRMEQSEARIKASNRKWSADR